MKKLFLAFVFLAVTLELTAQPPVFTQDDLQELVIDVKQDVDDCLVTIIIDDIYYALQSHQINGSQITLYVAEGQDYLIVINCKEYINISPLMREIIDERDMSISADVDYQFEKGILVFNF